jgi:hypothetical protein
LSRLFIALPLVAVLIATTHAEERKGRPGMEGRSLSESEISLHDLMEPIWRSPRTEAPSRACADGGAIQARVDAAVGAKGTSAFLPMSKTANELVRACKENRSQDVSRLLDELHRQFHKVIGME